MPQSTLTPEQIEGLRSASAEDIQDLLQDTRFQAVFPTLPPDIQQRLLSVVEASGPEGPPDLGRILLGGEQPPPASPAEAAVPPGEQLKSVLGLMGRGLELGTAFVPLPGAAGAGPLLSTALRTLLASGAGGLTAAMEGEAPFERAMEQGALTAGGGLLGEALPRVGYWTALTGAGLRENVGKTAKAFLNTRRRLPFGKAIPVGGVEAMKTQKARLGKKLATLEGANPAKVPRAALQGATQQAQAGARFGGKPTLTRKKLILEEADVLRNQAPSLSIRDLGNLKRGQGQAGRNIIRAREAGQVIPTGENVTGQVGSAMAKRARGLQEAVAPEVVPVNAAISDLHRMLGAEKSLGARSGMGARLGDMAVRGGFGAGTFTYPIMQATDLSTPQAMMLAGLIGQIGFAPGVASRAGSWAGRVAEQTPNAARTTNIIDYLYRELQKRGQKETP